MRAVTLPLDADIALDDIAGNDGTLFVRNGVGFAGRGVAARVPVDEAVEFLAAIDHDDRVGATPGPIAIGAIPFLPNSPATLQIPLVTVGVDASGRKWVTRIDASEEPLHAAIKPTERGQAFAFRAGSPISLDGVVTRLERLAANFTIRHLVQTSHYLAAVDTARDAVRSGLIAKAVIARPIMLECDRPIDVHSLLVRLGSAFATSHRFSIDGFVGASPELLVEVDDDIVRSHPLAGTTRTTGDDLIDAALAAELQASEKNQVEHRAAIDMVRETLLPYCSYLDWAAEPSIVKVANVQHLGSQAEGRLSSPVPSVIELVRAMQPTPAVGGYPRDAAIKIITDTEGFERGLYGGTVGWVDARGNGSWAVALRCAEFSADRRSARLVAGGGIVAESDPMSELAEVNAKLQAMLRAITDD